MDDEYDADTDDERDQPEYVFFDDEDGDDDPAVGDDGTAQQDGESSGDNKVRLNGLVPPADAFLLPARVLLNGSELKGGSWHSAAVELSAAVEADLAFHRSKWFVPVGRTLRCYQDWTVAMAYHGAVYRTERHTKNAAAVAECNQRSSNLQRHCSRMLVKYGLTATVGSKSPAADLYYAAVAVLIDAGKVTKWVRRRDLRTD